MRLFNGLAFCSLFHPRVPRNLRARPPRALRLVGLGLGMLWPAYSHAKHYARACTMQESGTGSTMR